MSTIGERLREERTRLNLTQDRFSEVLGINKRTVLNYEQGKRSPDADCLATVAAIGGDVLYILTGQRSLPVAPTAGLSRREQALLDNYQHTDEAGKKIIEGTALMAAESAAAKQNKAA